MKKAFLLILAIVAAGVLASAGAYRAHGATVLGQTTNDTWLPGFFTNQNNVKKLIDGVNAHHGTNVFDSSVAPGGGGGGGGTITTTNVLYVMKNGNDTTGRSNRLDLPFLTITAAKNKSHPGDTIVVYPGTYDETDIATNSVSFHFYPKANVVYTGTNQTPIFTITGATTITGSGCFTNNNQATAVDSPIIFNVVSGYLSAEFDSASTTNSTSSVFWQTNGVAYVKCNSMHGNYAVVFWKGGDTYIDAGSIVSDTPEYAVWPECDHVTTDYLWIRASHVSGFYSASVFNDASARSWVTCQYINKIDAHSGKNYITAQKADFINATEDVELWYDIQKVSANSATAIVLSGGKTWGRIQQIEDPNNLATALISAGVGEHHLTVMDGKGGTNANGIVYSENGKLFFNGKIDTTLNPMGLPFTAAGFIPSSDNIKLEGEFIAADGHPPMLIDEGSIYVNAKVKAPVQSGTGTYIGRLEMNGVDLLATGKQISLPKDADYTASQFDEFIPVDATAGNITITLPTSREGKDYIVKKVDASLNTVTIVGASAETFDGASDQTLLTQGQVLRVRRMNESEGADWFVW